MQDYEQSTQEIKDFFNAYTLAPKSGSSDLIFTGTEMPGKEFYLRIFCPFSSIGNDTRTTLVLEVEVYKPTIDTNPSPVEEFQKEDPGDTLNALYSSSLFGTSIIETTPELPEPTTSNEEVKTVSVSLFENANQTVSMVTFDVKRISLDLNTNRDVVYSIISTFTTSSGSQVTDYLEKNESQKRLERQIIAQEYDQQIKLIIYRPESSTAGRVLQNEDQVILNMTFDKMTSPGTGSENNTDGNDNSTDGNGNGTGSTEGGSQTGSTGNTGETGNTENNGSSNNGANHNGSACTGNDCTGTDSGENSFDYSMLAIILGAIAFLILVSSVIAALINQRRKNRILKRKIKRTGTLNQSEGSQPELINPYKSSKIRFKKKKPKNPPQR